MNLPISILPAGFVTGNYRIVSCLKQGNDFIDYNAVEISSNTPVVLREYTSAGVAVRDAEGSISAHPGQEESYQKGREVFLSAANPTGLTGTFDALGSSYLVYAVQQAAPAVAPRPRPLPVVRSSGRSSGMGGILVALLAFAALAGGGAFLWNNYRASQEAEMENQRVARQNAEVERQKREAAENAAREREEQARLAAEAARNRNADAVVVVDDAIKGENVIDNGKIVDEEPDGPPIAKDDDPRLGVYEGTATLLGVNATNTKNAEQWSKAFNTAFETNRYDKFKDYLERSLKESAGKMISFGKFELKTFYDSPQFRLVMKQYQFLSLVEMDTIVHAMADENGESFYRYLLEDKDESLTMFLRSLSGDETPSDLSRIMNTWMEFWTAESEPEMQKKYLPLSLACALVNPSTLGPAKTRYEGAATMPEIYQFFREKSEKNMLKGDITKMKPWNLVHVVNVRMPLSEMEWAVQKMRQKGLSRRNWSEAYPMVKYRMDQAANRRDIYEDYTLSEILKEGGTCMDQGYFATNTAKSNGIPAAYVTGDGKLGPHAWFIYMPDDENWNTAGGYGYTSGKTTSPQTAKSVHESLFLTAGDKRNSGKRLDQTRDLLEIFKTMQKLGMEGIAQDLLTQAQLSTPEHPMPWEATIAYFKREGNTTKLEEWEFLADTLRRRFKKRPDYLELAQDIEDEYIFPHKSDLQRNNELARQRRKLERDTNEGRADISAEAVKRQAEQLVKQGKYDELNVFYKKAMRDYGSRTDAFKDIIQQYFGYASNAPDKEKRMEQAVKEIDRSFQKYANTNSSNLFVCKQEVALQKTIAGFYRKIGDEKKADSLVRQGDLRIKRVERTIKPQ